jgi:hypothetical protein
LEVWLEEELGKQMESRLGCTKVVLAQATLTVRELGAQKEEQLGVVMELLKVSKLGLVTAIWLEQVMAI